VEGMIVARNNYINKEDFLYLYPPPYKVVLNQRNICNGFKGSSLKSLDKD
jgi:hypothetical protein